MTDKIILNKEGKDVEVITIRLPKPIVNWLDSLIEKGIYNSRSEMIRDFSREFVKRNKSDLLE